MGDAEIKFPKSKKITCPIRQAKKQYIQFYSKYTPIEFEFVRQSLMNLVQDQHTRISMFLRNQVQDEKGRFIMTGIGNSADSRVPYQCINNDVVDVCYRGSELGKSLYHIFGRKGTGGPVKTVASSSSK